MNKVLVILASVLLMCGCGGKQAPDGRVIGTWVQDTTDAVYPTENVLTFNEDGTYTAFYPALRPEDGFEDINDEGTYTTKEVAKPAKWKYGACIVVVESDYGNDFEVEFHFDEGGNSAMVDFYEIHTARDGTKSIDERKYDTGFYVKK